MKSIVRDIYPPNGTAELTRAIVLPGGISGDSSVRGIFTCSVNNDDDARWLAQRLHRSFSSSVDVNPRFHGWLLLVIGARSVKLSIAQHNAALGENGTLQFCDSQGIGPITQLPGDALSQAFRRPTQPRGL